MTDVKKKSTRRAFFLNGGAVLGAGVAATAGAASLGSSPQAGATRGDDREAIRQVHLALMTRLENQGDESATRLFDEHGHVRLGAYRQTTSQHKEEVRVSDDGLRATATFHCEVELCTPLQGDSTIAQMARLQGHVASRRWESGRFEASYVKTRDVWTIASLKYTAA